MQKYITYACDIGSTIRDNFAWVKLSHDGHVQIAQQGGAQCIEQMRDSLIVDILNNERISFGIEAPLFIPIPRYAEDLSRGRNGEGNRSCFAPAGAYAALLALHQMCWLFKNIHDEMLRHHHDLRFSLDIDDWRNTDNKLLIWEAFISGDGHAAADNINGHVADAYSAAELFRRFEKGQHLINADNIVMLYPDDISLSLIEFALLHSRVIENKEQIKNVEIIVLRAEYPIPLPQDIGM